MEGGCEVVSLRVFGDFFNNRNMMVVAAGDFCVSQCFFVIQKMLLNDASCVNTFLFSGYDFCLKMFELFP